MKALTTLRHLIVLLVFAAAAATASASDGARKQHKNSSKPAVERTAAPQRKQVAAFVDPTLPLAELVERVRSEQKP